MQTATYFVTDGHGWFCGYKVDFSSGQTVSFWSTKANDANPIPTRERAEIIAARFDGGKVVEK